MQGIFLEIRLNRRPQSNLRGGEMMDNVSQEFTCICGKQKAWITDGEETKSPCPECGRRYKGKYNHKTYQIDAIEINQP